MKDDNFATVIRLAVKNKKAVRIGVNWGSLDKELLAQLMDANQSAKDPRSVQEIMYDAMIESALANCRYALDLGLPKEKMVVSAKLSVVQDIIEVYQRLAQQCDYALHVGLTEAGGGVKGIASSAAGLAILLQQGIGDTIRVSLTPEPGAPRAKEVEVAQEILQSMGFRYFIPSITSCPGCGRTTSIYFQTLARDVREHVAARIKEWRVAYPGVEQLKIAVMGCVVNGPGESRHADIGISLPGSFEEPMAPVFINGEKKMTLKGEHIREEFIALLETYIKEKFGREKVTAH
jgi:(E)-4-hydroxy-3-methylbut-2-enyl-diphosphate synthase